MKPDYSGSEWPGVDSCFFHAIVVKRIDRLLEMGGRVGRKESRKDDGGIEVF